jgi:hypothetical protein
MQIDVRGTRSRSSAPAAHDPQIRERLAERIPRRRMEPEYEPAARRERSMNPLQH